MEEWKCKDIRYFQSYQQQNKQTKATKRGEPLWLMLVILVTQEAGIRKITV
jgi:hypothetical protein